MKQYIFTIIFFVLGFIFVQAQPQDNNFQKTYSQVQTVLNKDVSALTSSDVNILKDAARLESNYFGEANQRLVSKMIQDSKAKLAEHNQYLKTQDDLKRTQQDLEMTTDAWKQSEVRGDSLFAENVQLKVLINELTKRIDKLDKESKKLQSINKKIQQENLQTKDMLETSRKTIKNIMTLLPPSAQKNELSDQIPGTLQDSLNQSECQVAELLKNNFILTLEGFKRDQAFLDSASNYFKENLMHLQIIDEYISIGMDLSTRLKSQGTDCTSNYAAEIETSISDFKAMIESTDLSFSAKVARFFSENTGIVIALAVMLVIIIVFVFIRRK